MIDVTAFRELVSGQRRGIGAALARGALQLAEVPYALAVRLRNRRYDRRPQASFSAGVPVVSIGNLTTGGTGKTPFTAWLARWFRRHELRVALVSRGYKASARGTNDEALELEEQLPDVPHLQNPDRVAAARVAVEELAAQVILLDDGFQHRRLRRDMDLLLVDALEPFGYGHLLPRGLLREPLAALSRAQIVALSRADAILADQRQQIRAVVARYAPQAAWLEVRHAPARLRNAQGEFADLETYRGRVVAAFCGIGNPAGFRHTLEQCGYHVAAWREFPDHHAYRREDVAALVAWAATLGPVEAILCTHKDLVKLGIDGLGRLPLWALAVEIQFLAGEAELDARLQPLVAMARQSPDF